MTGIRIGITFFVLFIFNTTFACTDSYSSIADSACGTYGSPSGKYWWSNSGTYLDTIPNIAGCDSIITLEITIHSIPIVHFSVIQNSGCSPLSTTFNNLSFGTNLTYTWDFGDGTITNLTNEQVTHTYTTKGNYDVSLTAKSNYNCSATVVIMDLIRIHDINLNINSIIEPCHEEALLTIENDSIEHILWSTGETTKTITVYEEGKYQVTVFDNFGCTDKKDLDVKFIFCKKPGGIKLFPNPSHGLVNIENVQPNSTVKIIALNGHIYPVGLTNSKGKLMADVRFLPDGIYSIQVNTDGDIRSKKLFIIRPD